MIDTHNPIVKDNAKDTINQAISNLRYISSRLHQQANLEQAALEDRDPDQTSLDLAALATFVECNQAALETCYEQHNCETALLTGEIKQLKAQLKVDKPDGDKPDGARPADSKP